MVDWNSAAELARDTVAFNNLMHVLAGLVIWEWWISLGFEWSLVTGQRAFRWPMIFYFLGRYGLLGVLIGLLVALNVTQEVDCQALYTIIQVCGNVAIGSSSINLSLRTIAVWSMNKWIVIPIVAVILGHWSILLHGVLLTAEYFPGEGCVLVAENSSILAATFIYSMCFDFIILILTAYKLAYTNSGRSPLFRVIFQDGLIYFVVAFCANLVATVFLQLSLNPIMAIIFNVPAGAASTIMACRAVRRLSKWFEESSVISLGASGQKSGLAFMATTTTTAVNPPRVVTSLANPAQDRQGGVRVHMNRFTITEDYHEESESSYYRPNPGLSRVPEDAEAQVHRDEVKRGEYIEDY